MRFSFNLSHKMCELIRVGGAGVRKSRMAHNRYVLLSFSDLMPLELQRPKDASNKICTKQTKNTEMIHHLEWMPPQADNTVREKHSSKLLA